MRTKFKPWAAPYISEHQEYMITLDDVLNLGDCLNIEIGSGKGKFIVDMAIKFPHLQFIGIERNVTALGFALKKIVEQELTNVKMFFGDAFLLLEKLPSHTIKHLFLNFSDPWPKKRHEKRRLTHDNFLKKYYDALDNNGKLIFKTDNTDLFLFKRVSSNKKELYLIAKPPKTFGLTSYFIIIEEFNFSSKTFKSLLCWIFDSGTAVSTKTSTIPLSS